MIQRPKVVLLIAACIIITYLAGSAQAFLFSNIFGKSPTNIFKKPSDSDVSELRNSPTAPWVKDEYLPTIEEFKKNVFADVNASTEIQKFKDFRSDSTSTRRIVFNLINKFLTDLGHPVPASLANDASEIASLFDPITLPILVETDAVHLAEFLLIHNIKIDRDTSKNYADSLSKAFESAKQDDLESQWQALLDGYAAFILSYKFDLGKVIDELLEGLLSYLVVILARPSP